MAENSKIQWTHHTFNAWRGCTKVSPGCAHCYAEVLSKRNPGALGAWGKDGERVVAAASYWKQPLKWNADAEKAGERRRVFCASLADVFEGPETMRTGLYSTVRNARVRLFETIERTPWLDWLLLTKRPENVVWQVEEVYQGCRCIESKWPLKNVWLGVSVEDQARADERIPLLIKTPAAVRFLSCEPLLGQVDLSEWLYTLKVEHNGDGDTQEVSCRPDLHWVIVGGESGHGARPCDLGWVRSITRQCAESQVACFVKQLGARPTGRWQHDGVAPYPSDHWKLKDHKGGDIEEFPEGLRVRQFPKVAV